MIRVHLKARSRVVSSEQTYDQALHAQQLLLQCIVCSSTKGWFVTRQTQALLFQAFLPQFERSHRLDCCPLVGMKMPQQFLLPTVIRRFGGMCNLPYPASPSEIALQFI